MTITIEPIYDMTLEEFLADYSKSISEIPQEERKGPWLLTDTENIYYGPFNTLEDGLEWLTRNADLFRHEGSSKYSNNLHCCVITK